MTFSVTVNEDNSIGMIYLDTELTDSGEWFRNQFFFLISGKTLNGYHKDRISDLNTVKNKKRHSFIII